MHPELATAAAKAFVLFHPLGVNASVRVASPTKRMASANVSAEFAAAAAAMEPDVRRLLVDGEDPANVSVESLLTALGRDAPSHVSMAYEAPVATFPRLLSVRACTTLRAAVDAQRRLERDSVDGGPEHQLNLSREALELLIGKEECLRLWALPRRFRLANAVVLAPSPDQAASDSGAPSPAAAEDAAAAAAVEAMGELRECFVRRYSTDTRPWIPFHTDAYEITVNVALSADNGHGGGRLLGAHGGKICALERAEGDATVHSSKLLHGVSAMTRGVRYSLIVFSDRRGVASGRWA
jgi:hypothetical protein